MLFLFLEILRFVVFMTKDSRDINSEQLFLIIVNSIPYGAVLSVDDHISLIFSGQAFCFPNGRILAPVFGGNSLISLPPYGPTGIIRDYVLVPGPSTFTLTRTFKKELHQFTQNVYPGAGSVAFGHLAFFGFTEDTVLKKEKPTP